MAEQIQENGQQQQEEKTFSQADVNRLMAAEKESGRRSILKELGVEDITSAKEGLQKYQEYLNSQKTELQQAQEAQTKLQGDYAAAIAKATRAENCMIAMKLGANADSLDDLVALAATKVTDTKNFEAVLTEMKSNSVYAGFFKGSVGTGTGGMQGQSADKGSDVSLAKSLAEKQRNTQKSSYFKMS